MDDDRAIVVNCPVCHRTIWSWAICRHGQVPPPGPDAPTEPELPSPPPEKPRTFPTKPGKPPKV